MLVAAAPASAGTVCSVAGTATFVANDLASGCGGANDGGLGRGSRDTRYQADLLFGAGLLLVAWIGAKLAFIQAYSWFHPALPGGSHHRARTGRAGDKGWYECIEAVPVERSSVQQEHWCPGAGEVHVSIITSPVSNDCSKSFSFRPAN